MFNFNIARVLKEDKYTFPQAHEFNLTSSPIVFDESEAICFPHKWLDNCPTKVYCVSAHLVYPAHTHQLVGIFPHTTRE